MLGKLSKELQGYQKCNKNFLWALVQGYFNETLQKYVRFCVFGVSSLDYDVCGGNALYVHK